MESLPIINRTYEVYKLVVDLTGHMEKRWRYSLGQSLEASVLSCLEQLILAKNAPKTLKTGYLLQASSHLEIAVLKCRLCLEVSDANETKIFQAQSKCAEIGRMLGGWLKSLT
ncbi:MAG: four helix bundle protein [Candidatus Komeilibacteria bacterium]|nr:four helix bundle protein [Candidatus Komeilibacteria bacterium]